MPTDASSRRIYEFGEWRLDPGEHLLLRQGNPVPLTPKVFQTLVILVENACRLVPKDEFMRRVWPDAFVEEAALAQNISLLRKTLATSATNGAAIETVPKRGYRLLAAVRALDVRDEGASAAVPSVAGATLSLRDETGIASQGIAATHPRRQTGATRLIVYAGLVLLLLALSVTYVRWRSRGTRAAGPILVHSIAVLPLENLSNDPAQDYFADGMTDELITDLGQIKALRVISRTSVMQYKGIRKPIAEIARELNVDAVVEGTILKSGNQVRITAQLIQAPLDKHLWARSYQGDLHDVLSLQNSVASAIAAEIQVTLTPHEQALLRAERPVNLQAYENYLLGRYFWNKRDGGGLQKAAEYFQQAINCDPKYAPAYASLAQTYILLADNLGPKKEFLAEGKKAAQQALALDPNLAEAHTALGMLLESDYNFAQEEQEFKLAVTLDPNYATAHHWYGESYLAQIGRFDEAEREMRQALLLDPVSRIIATDQGVLLYWERRYDDAYQQITKALALDSGFSEAYLCRGKVLLQQGKYKAAITDLETAYRINPANPAIPATLAYGYGLTGNRSKAAFQLRALLAESETNAWAIGLVYLGLGDKVRSMDWFEKAVRERSGDMIDVRVEPVYDALRQEPRFKQLLLRMNLPD
jgi:TolB-like protein/DNA-binding winged helix-turn-helix (wHTH) protein/Tfp pilus assembly protein PilF